MPWLTPDSIPESTQCGTLLIPDNPQVIAAVIGALYDLTLVENWEQYGAITPAQMASAMVTMFDGFFNPCESVSSVLVGSIVAYTGNFDALPAEWYRCTGMIFLKADYPDLYAVIGDAYNGGGLTADEFQIPDLRGRIIIGEVGTIGVLGDRLGDDEHTLSIAELPAHSHTQRGATASSGTLASAVTQNNTASGVTTTTTTSSVGSGTPFSILNPVVVCNWIIRILP